ncbi:MAG: hypothetical protein IKG79_01385 [Neisseriaceae bacterium]|nr:hypothetical protein [Neisseriaceae bacterium]
MAVFSAAEWTPYSSHITPEIIKIKGGAYLMSFKLSGVAYIGIEQDIIDSRIRQMSKFVAQLKAPYRHNLYMHAHCVKRNIKAGLPETFERQSFAHELDNDYLKNAIYSTPIIGTEYYLSVIYKPLRYGKLSTGFRPTRKTIIEHQEMAIEALGKMKNLVQEYFSDYGAKILSCYETGGVVYSEVLTFLSLLLNLDDIPVPIMKAQISEYLPKAYFTLGDSEYIQIDTAGHAPQYATILSFAAYPAATYAGIIQKFLTLPWRMIVSQTFQPINKDEAKDWLEREHRRLASSDSVTDSELEDFEEARENVTADNTILGEYYFQAALISDDLEDLKQKASEAQAIFSECGFTAAAFKLAKLYAWFSALPGNVSFQPRECKLTNQNACQILPYQVTSCGKQFGNPWGQAITMFRTVSDEVFYFNFHDTEQGEDATGALAVGNTLIAGMTGAGKTVLLSFLLAQAQRFANKPKTIIFDKDLGSSVFVKAMNGKYSRIQQGTATGFNPFQLPNTPQNRAFLLELMTAILESSGSPLTVKEKNEVEEAITQTMSSDKEHRKISAFRNLFIDGDNGIRQRLTSWATGEYAWVFNNVDDNFSLDGNIVGIDYTDFLDIEAIRTPILMYLFYRIELMLDGKPVIISLDEAWKPLSDPTFARFIENKERTIRKQNGILILTTQSPADFFREEETKVLVEQTVTQILLPNPKAKKEDYIGGLKLSEEEFQIIKDMNPKSRQFLVRQSGESTHCKLNLKGVQAVDVLSGSLARALHAEKLQKQYGDEWLEKYYETVKEVGSYVLREELNEETQRNDDDEVQAA